MESGLFGARFCVFYEEIDVLPSQTCFIDVENFLLPLESGCLLGYNNCTKVQYL